MRLRIAKITVFLSALAMALPAGASGGTNGQQLAFAPGCNSNWAYVRGHNQRNQVVSQWVLVPAEAPEGGCYGVAVFDRGWWWKGTIRVDSYWRRGREYVGTVFVNVPKSYPSDWFYVTMPGG